MNFRTTVELPVSPSPVTHNGRILLMGSCFAENMGLMLSESKFPMDVNPFGVLYNPFSIAAALRQIDSEKEYEEADLFFYKELWHSSMHHGSFSAFTAAETLANIHVRLQKARQWMPELSWLMLTLGSAYVYQERETGRIVSNCHQLAERHFVRRRLSVDEIVDEYVPLLTALIRRNPRLKCLFTVSPIWHARDGMHGNQLSKSTLLLAVERLQQLFPEQVCYFPSYEIVMDELRDYRFYADDMLHPSPLAIRYLWERFSETFFSAETKQVIEAVEEIRRDLSHRPFHPESEAYQLFLGQIVLKIERLNGKYTNLGFQKELELCHIRSNP